jgi:hypothetical protein
MMITRAVIYIDDEPRINIGSESGLTSPELEIEEDPGYDVDQIRFNLESAFHGLFPESSIECRFPEFGECS